MTTTTAPEPTTDTFTTGTEWGVRYTWTDGHTEVDIRRTRLSAETGAEAQRRPDRATEAVYRVDGDSPWQPLPVLSQRHARHAVTDRPQSTVSIVFGIVAGGLGALVQVLIPAALGAALMYLWVKGQI